MQSKLKQARCLFSQITKLLIPIQNSAIKTKNQKIARFKHLQFKIYLDKRICSMSTTIEE